RPDPRDAEELHDALLELVVLRPDAAWSSWFDELCRAGRAACALTVEGALWLATERREHVDALFPEAPVEPDVRLPASARSAGRPEIDEEAATVVMTRGYLATMGPATAADLALRVGRPVSAVEQALAKLEAEGFALRGRFDPERDEADRAVEFCERRLLARIHRYTTDRLRREIEPVTAQDFMRFLLRWQHVAPETQMAGRRGLLAVIEQLQGFEVAAGSWEEAVLPARVAGYRPEWLDDLCLSGEVAWGRFTTRAANGAGDAPEETGGRGGAVPSRATPVTFALRDNLDWLLRAARGPARPAPPGDGAARDILEALRARGALFYNDLAAVTGRLRVEVEEGLWDLVSRGLVTADGFG
ncbi:MAG TPA: DEAD/DEAH box helicase, partial [Planctomycetota bacterium]|nr:DEAD/DEAH box helicase [Planctomycetota bacterium]